MKSKLKFIIPLVLVIMGGTYKFVLAKPAPTPKPKIGGEVYVLPKDFLINLDGAKFAKLGVAMVFDHGFTAIPPPAGGHGAAAEPAAGYGVLLQEPLVRAIITDVLTDQKAKRLASAEGREHLQEEILERIKKETDVKAHELLFTDVAIQ